MKHLNCDSVIRTGTIIRAFKFYRFGYEKSYRIGRIESYHSVVHDINRSVPRPKIVSLIQAVGCFEKT